MPDRLDAPPFNRIGPVEPATPVVLSVPHAGRAYGETLLRSARVSQNVLEALEDRLVDRLVWRAVADGATAVVATAPRAEIDLNRDVRELDPTMVVPAPPSDEIMPSLRTRGGLGLVPARLAGAGGLWRGRMSRDELRRRVETIYRPYHAAIAAALDAARRRFGCAMLLDCHSMPPRPDGKGPDLVLGDRHGTTASQPAMAAAMDAAQSLGFTTACNEPYAGGYVVERHGRPAAGIFALQIEIDRSLYLDDALREAGPGFDRATRLFARIAETTGAAILDEPLTLAAE